MEASWIFLLQAAKARPEIGRVARRLAMVWAIFGISCGIPAAAILISPLVPTWAKLVVFLIGAAYWVVGSWAYLKYAE